MKLLRFNSFQCYHTEDIHLYYHECLGFVSTSTSNPDNHYQKVEIKEEDKEYFVLLIKTDHLTKQSVKEKLNNFFRENWQIESISYAPLEYNDEENFTNSALQSLSHTMEYTSDLRQLDKDINYKFDTGLELKSIAIHLVRTYRKGQNPDA